MIEEKFTDLYAANSKVPVTIARQEIVLTYVLALLREKNLLSQLAFKGGTCLRKVFFGKQYRFSEDLDFTGLVKAKSSTVLDEIREAFSSPYYDISFQEVIGSARTTGGGVSAGIQFEYRTLAGTGTFGLEISYRAQPIFPVSAKRLQQQSYYKQLEIIVPDVYTLNLEEIVAEKVRATFQRTRPRDVYDLYFCFQKPISIPIVKTLTILKCWEVRDPFNIDIFLSNLHSTKYRWEELDFLLPKGSRPDSKKMVKLVESKVNIFANLSDQEKEIIEDSKRHREKLLVERVVADLKGNMKNF